MVMAFMKSLGPNRGDMRAKPFKFGNGVIKNPRFGRHETPRTVTEPRIRQLMSKLALPK